MNLWRLGSSLLGNVATCQNVHISLPILGQYISVHQLLDRAWRREYTGRSSWRWVHHGQLATVWAELCKRQALGVLLQHNCHVSKQARFELKKLACSIWAEFVLNHDLDNTRNHCLSCSEALVVIWEDRRIDEHEVCPVMLKYIVQCDLGIGYRYFDCGSARWLSRESRPHFLGRGLWWCMETRIAIELTKGSLFLSHCRMWYLEGNYNGHSFNDAGHPSLYSGQSQFRIYELFPVY